MISLENINFDNTFSRLPQAFYRLVKTTPLPKPYLVSFNQQVADLIGIDADEAAKPDFVEYFIGNKMLNGSQPLAAIYAGHQFGSFVSQLGDGRAILLGEAVNEAGNRFDIQLKGAGMTPFSRMGDGRAVLRSTIREYLCGEAMYALGIPTTRALCIVGSDAPVYRETVESAAVLTRISPSHVRFGSFELFYYRGQHEQVQQLLDYVITEFYPQLVDSKDKYVDFLREITTRTAKLMAKWQSVGFCHGVMNTDNMSILGQTIDYGPFGFLDEFDAEFICNHSDHAGRYAYNQQPNVGLWNLYCLAQTFVSMISPEEIEEVLAEYQTVFPQHYAELMSAKLGFSKHNEEVDGLLLSTLLEILQKSEVDYSQFFRRLCDFNSSKNAKNGLLQGMFIDPKSFDNWAEKYQIRLESEKSVDAERSLRMKAVNPKFVLRNHIAQSAIEKAENKDYSEVDILLELLQNPFDEHSEFEHFAKPPAKGAPKIEVSCSS
jgi:serine/tyrosine/threonine adenylyltransferase